MKQFQKNLLAAAAGSCIFASSAVYAEDAASISEALANGDTKLHLRLRYESADIDGVEKGQATTLKTRLTYTSGTFNGFGLTLEADDTTELLDEDYNNGIVAQNPETAAIVDPEVTEINQAFLSYKTGETVFKYGRQRILLDNQRFVGGVGWRQDEQTYDALSISSKPIEGLSLFYAYVMDVNRIFAEALDSNHESHLINAQYKFSDALTTTAYAYLLDNDGKRAPLIRHASDTMGLNAKGSISGFQYYAEYATQSNAGVNENEYDADYIHLNGGYTFSPITITAGMEILGSDDNGYFVTPLATLHKFQGWTDKFLGAGGDGAAGTGNIRGGIEDTYISVAGKFGKIAASVVYHSYESESPERASSDANFGGDLGSEVGFTVATKAGPVGLLLKYSDYSKGDWGADTTKIWLQAAATF